jgi:short chain dehydrogenase
MNRFDGRTVVVTGASGGIGAACARRLFSEGANVAALDLSQTGADKIALELGGRPRVLPLAIDAVDPAGIEAALDAVKRHFGRLDGMIHCARPDAFDNGLVVRVFNRALRGESASCGVVTVAPTAGIAVRGKRTPYRVFSSNGSTGACRATPPARRTDEPDELASVAVDLLAGEEQWATAVTPPIRKGWMTAFAML